MGVVGVGVVVGGAGVVVAAAAAARASRPTVVIGKVIAMRVRAGEVPTLDSQRISHHFTSQVNSNLHHAL